MNGLTVEERLKRLEEGYHNNRLEGQIVSPGRMEVLRGMIRAGMSSDEIAKSIIADYATRGPQKQPA